jgi:hypothetical protein
MAFDAVPQIPQIPQFDDKLQNYDALRAAIMAAWEAVDAAYLDELLESMPQRCQAVIDADGSHIRT